MISCNDFVSVGIMLSKSLIGESSAEVEPNEEDTSGTNERMYKRTQICPHGMLDMTLYFIVTDNKSHH